MGHYNDYYAEEAHKSRVFRKKELEKALGKLDKLLSWDYEQKYILPESVRKEITETAIKSIHAELYGLMDINET